MLPEPCISCPKSVCGGREGCPFLPPKEEEITHIPFPSFRRKKVLQIPANIAALLHTMGIHPSYKGRCSIKVKIEKGKPFLIFHRNGKKKEKIKISGKIKKPIVLRFMDNRLISVTYPKT